MEALALLGMILLFNPNAEPMSTQDMYLESTYMAFHVADWGQTRDIATRQPEYKANSAINYHQIDDYHEHNTIIGRNPSIQDVDRYFLATAILHAGITKSLPSKYREKFQLVTIGIEAGYVHHNAKIGLKVKF